MTRQTITLVMALFLLSHSASAATWTDNTGQYTVEAEFLAGVGGHDLVRHPGPHTCLGHRPLSSCHCGVMVSYDTLRQVIPHVGVQVVGAHNLQQNVKCHDS